MDSPSSDLFDPSQQDINKFRQERARKVPASIRYVVWFTPRSGSSWLTEIARSTRRLSNPGECFNPNFVPLMAKHLNVSNMDQYIQILLRRRNMRGVFGCELTFHHLQASFDDPEDFLRYFDGAPAIWLIRQDIVAQAVSLAKMQTTKISHSVQATPEERAEAEQNYTYDAKMIEKFLHHIQRAETGCEDLFAKYGHQPLRLSYEQNMEMGVVNAIAHHIGIRPIQHQTIETGHQKLGTDRNAEFAERFREENRAVVEEINDIRRDRLAALDTDLPDRLPKPYREGRAPGNRPKTA